MIYGISQMEKQKQVKAVPALSLPWMGGEGGTQHITASTRSSGKKALDRKNALVRLPPSPLIQNSVECQYVE